MATPAQEAAAKQAGFQNYEQQLAWSRRRVEATGGTTAAPRIEGQSAPRAVPRAVPQPAPLGGGVMGIYDYIAGVLSGANR